MQSISEILRRAEVFKAALIERRFLNANEPVGWSDARIADLEQRIGAALPEAYRAFLRTIGPWDGFATTAVDWDPDSIRIAHDEFAVESDHHLPPGAFPCWFDDYLSEYAGYFMLGESDDPPPFRFCYETGSAERIGDSFWDVLEETWSLSNESEPYMSKGFHRRAHLLTDELIARGMIPADGSAGCTPQEIADLQQRLPFKLPSSFKLFLTLLGRRAGQAFPHLRIGITELEYVHALAADTSGGNHTIPKTMFPCWSDHAGQTIWMFSVLERMSSYYANLCRFDRQTGHWAAAGELWEVLQAANGQAENEPETGTGDRSN